MLGRLADATNQLEKKEMLNFVRKGASHIINMKDCDDITDEDIDKILEKAEKKVGYLNSNKQTLLAAFHLLI